MPGVASGKKTEPQRWGRRLQWLEKALLRKLHTGIILEAQAPTAPTTSGQSLGGVYNIQCQKGKMRLREGKELASGHPPSNSDTHRICAWVSKACTGQPFLSADDPDMCV